MEWKDRRDIEGKFSYTIHKQPPEVLYEKTFLKSFNIQEHVCIKVYFSIKLQA